MEHEPAALATIIYPIRLLIRQRTSPSGPPTNGVTPPLHGAAENLTGSLFWPRRPFTAVAFPVLCCTGIVDDAFPVHAESKIVGLAFRYGAMSGGNLEDDEPQEGICVSNGVRVV